MYKCLKCNKDFPTPSKLEIHKNRKNPCNKKKEYKFHLGKEKNPKILLQFVNTFSVI